MNNNLSILANRPAIHQRMLPPASIVAEAGEAQVKIVPPSPSPLGPPIAAKLSDCSRSLHDLWLEYEIGLIGKKAAKYFS